jgi:hypothetical protein
VAEIWKAINYDDVKVAGYYHWSLLDNFEVRGRKGGREGGRGWKEGGVLLSCFLA